jgi:hypothetical protein
LMKLKGQAKSFGDNKSQKRGTAMGIGIDG